MWGGHRVQTKHILSTVLTEKSRPNIWVKLMEVTQTAPYVTSNRIKVYSLILGMLISYLLM